MATTHDSVEYSHNQQASFGSVSAQRMHTLNALQLVQGLLPCELRASSVCLRLQKRLESNQIWQPIRTQLNFARPDNCGSFHVRSENAYRTPFSSSRACCHAPELAPLPGPSASCICPRGAMRPACTNACKVKGSVRACT